MVHTSCTETLVLQHEQQAIIERVDYFAELSLLVGTLLTVDNAVQEATLEQCSIGRVVLFDIFIPLVHYACPLGQTFEIACTTQLISFRPRLTCTDKYQIWSKPLCCWSDNFIKHSR